MSSTPPLTDTPTGPTPHHVCPTCGQPAKSTVSRETSTGTVNTDCLCAYGHIWSVHWLGGAA